MLPADLAISAEKTAHGGRWVATTRDGPDSEMVYQTRREGVWTIVHTGVPAELEGRGIAGALMNRAIADARAAGVKIEPKCSYVTAAFQRHPEWGDVLAP